MNINSNINKVTIKSGVREHVIMVEDILPALLNLADISADKQPEHFLFEGKSIRASLEDKDFIESRDIFRLALAGPGAPDQTTTTGIIPDYTIEVQKLLSAIFVVQGTLQENA
jgi:arylsulfatase A-like enzyme